MPDNEVWEILLETDTQKITDETYGHKKRDSAESQPLLTLNLIL